MGMGGVHLGYITSVHLRLMHLFHLDILSYPEFKHAS